MHNPLRSERDVFRAVVLIAIALGAVIALTLLTRPAIGAALLALEIGLGIGLLWRGSLGALPHQAEVSHRDDPVYRVLVLANQTVGGRALLAEIQNRVKGRNSEILVVVPALTSTPLEHWASDVDEALAEAPEAPDCRPGGGGGAPRPASAWMPRLRRWGPPGSALAGTWGTITSRTRPSRTRCVISLPTR